MRLLLEKPVWPPEMLLADRPDTHVRRPMLAFEQWQCHADNAARV
jgi:hypothetical protein